MTFCPICRSNNYHKLVKNCHENIKFKNYSYAYKYCLNCLVVSLDPLPDNEN